ncbi:MAG: hypothetical protein GX653_09065, partial [Clostridiales bacterium]|nr:hypothetical protein [Clostridiales bacterium]
DQNGASPAEFTFYYQPYPINDATVRIYYKNADGTQDVATAQERTYPAGTHAVNPEPADLNPSYDPGSVAPQQVTVDQNGASPAEFTFYYQAYPIHDATVRIYYKNADGTQDVATAQERTYPAGTHAVNPEPADLNPAFDPNSVAPQQVTVDQNGASPAEFTFYYQAYPINDATVRIYYKNADGTQDVATPQERTYPAGTHAVNPEPADLNPAYDPNSVAPQQVTVDQNGANPSEITFYYQLLPIAKAEVRIHYLHEDNDEPVAPDQVVTYEAGEYDVSPSPEGLDSTYTLVTEPVVRVKVDANGATPAEVVFRYRQETAPVVAPDVEIDILYLDRENNPVASPQKKTVGDGTNTVKAEPTDLKEGYFLPEGTDVQYVIVTLNGADPSVVTFYYEQGATQPPAEEETPPPTPKTAIVNVYYKDQFGTIIGSYNVNCVQGQPNTIHADVSNLTVANPADYVLNDEAQKTVTVDENGVATPLEVVFLFTNNNPQVTVDVTVRYQQEGGEPVAEPTVQRLTKVGPADIMAQPVNLQEGFELVSPELQQVTVNENGTVTPAEVIFTYKAKAATPEPAATEIPYEVKPLENVFGRPTSDKINFRSAPDSDQDNSVATVTTNDVAHLLGEVVNSKKEVWYLAEINGTRAFIKQTVVKLMTEEEVYKHFGWTPAPPKEPTPKPEGMPLDLWAQTNSTVRFRSSTDTKPSNNILLDLNKAEKLWVYAQEVVGEDLWYSAMARGKEGYVMAKFVDLYTQEQSDAYQATLSSPAPTKSLPPTEKPVATTEPPKQTEAPATPAPATPQPVVQTPVPPTYTGYAVTTQQVALRTGADTKDESILATLPADRLLVVLGQTYVSGQMWHHVDVYGTSQAGFVPDSALRRINAQEAEYYKNRLQPTASAAPPPTRVPAQVSGYAITLGDNVPMRNYVDPNAQISRVLPANTIVSVRGQEYAMSDTWHLVQSGANYGFIRADQLRMLNNMEAQAYIESLRQPTPTPMATLAPMTQTSLSSYGYVNADKVRLRKSPSTSAVTLKMMDKNAFALVLSSSQEADGVWYRVNQGGTEGYVMGSYFTVLPINQLTQFLQSPAYQNANNVPAGTTTGGTPPRITPVEDFNAGVWQNPALAQASYEPFNPIATSTPPVEAILMPSVSPSAGGFVVADTSPTIDPLATFEPMGTDVPTKTTSRFPGGLLAAGIVAVLGGGGYYAYRMYQENQRRAAQRAAQRRQQAGQPGQQQPGGQTPYTRPAQPGAQPGTQGTTAYRPPTQPGQTPPGAQGTTTYRPPTQPGQTPPGAQGTTTYRPPTQPGQTPPGAQGTTTYRPPTQPGQTPPGAQGTTTYRPPTQPGQVPPGAQGTTTYRPPTQPGQVPPGAQGTATGQPAAQPGQSAPQQPAQTPEEAARQQAERRRRTDRHNS